MTKELIELNEKLEKALANGAVKFTFTKKDGTIRTAYGTNKPSIVHHHYTFVGDNRTKNPLQFRYFDLEKNEYRSFNKNRLISVA